MKPENLLPIAAPAPPAVIMGIMLYNEIIGASSPAWWAIAGIASLLGVVGMIGVEMYSYKQTMIAFARRETPAMIAALLGALLTSGLIIAAIYRSENSRPLVASVLIAIVGYIALSVRDYMATRQQAQNEHVAEANRETDNQIRLLDAQRRLTNAEARRGKVSSGRPVLSTGQTGQTGQLDKAILKIARDWFAAHPGASARDWLRDPSCPVKSPTTASNYKKAVAK